MNSPINTLFQSLVFSYTGQKRWLLSGDKWWNVRSCRVRDDFFHARDAYQWSPRHENQPPFLFTRGGSFWLKLVDHARAFLDQNKRLGASVGSDYLARRIHLAKLATRFNFLECARLGTRHFAVHILIPSEQVALTVYFLGSPHWWLEQNIAADLFQLKTKYIVFVLYCVLFFGFLGLLRVFSAKRFQKYSENSQHLTGKRIPILLKTWPSEQQASVQVISGGFGLFIFFSKFLDWIFNILVKHTVAKFAKSPLIFLTAFKTVFSPEKLGFWYFDQTIMQDVFIRRLFCRNWNLLPIVNWLSIFLSIFIIRWWTAVF